MNEIIINNIDYIKDKINYILSGNDILDIESIFKRINFYRDSNWFNSLKSTGSLPNCDGKTVGSVIEKLFVSILEKYIFNSKINLSISPARGIDIPELRLGIKAPSKNFCTSEPYFSAYDRILGNTYDSIILLTNYQEAKKENPFRLKILDIKYLRGSEIADKKLCYFAKKTREIYGDSLDTKKLLRFFSYVNQGDWEANQILKIIDEVIFKNSDFSQIISTIVYDYNKKNISNRNRNRDEIPEECLERICSIKDISPIKYGIINASENWVLINEKDNGRYPNDNEWNRFLSSPLDGKISMSFALQWRYNFRKIFNI